MSEEMIPEFMKLDQIPVDYVQQLETDLLEPVVQLEGSATREGQCRFELQNKGFLHSHSKLFVSLIPSVNGNASAAYLPQNIGIGSLIQSATLKVGNQVLNEISDWQYLHMIKSAQIDNEYQRNREQYVTGRCINHRFIFRDAAAGANNSVLAEKYGLDNGREYDGNNLKQLPFAVMSSDAVSESPTYSIDLSDLFPFLKTHQLPLYMIDAPITIEITWARTVQDRVCLPDVAGVSATAEYKIDGSELKFAADYIFYGATDEMARYAAANPVMEFNFPDYRLAKNSVNNNALDAGIVRNIGMANRLVSRVLTVFSPLKSFGPAEANILNNYQACSPNKNASNVPGAVSYNVRYNDRFEFSSDLTNLSRIHSMYVQAETVPFVTRQEFSDENLGLTALTFEGRQQNSFTHGLRGKFFCLATRLTNGRVGQRGIELHVKSNTTIGTNYTMRSYCEYMRTARLSNGMFEIFNV
jgi:hypothetical protein